MTQSTATKSRQHDSRLQEGVNTQYLHPYRMFGHSMLLTLGSNFHDNQIDVGLLHTPEQRVVNSSLFLKR